MAGGMCPKCGKAQEFPKRPYCLKCSAEEKKARREKNIEQSRAREKELWDRRTPEQKEKRRKTYKRWAKARREHRNAQRREWNKQRTPEQKAKTKGYQDAHYQKRQKKAIDHGLCAYTSKCNEPVIGKVRFCLAHWCRSFTSRDPRFKSAFTEEEVIDLWNRQSGKCALSGTDLVPGVNAELDHITPISIGGTHSISNLRFINSSLNKFKWKMDDKQFASVILSVCPSLIEWAKKNIS